MDLLVVGGVSCDALLQTLNIREFFQEKCLSLRLFRSCIEFHFYREVYTLMADLNVCTSLEYTLLPALPVSYRFLLCWVPLKRRGRQAIEGPET